jgi:FkbM family methyltransferase
MTSIYYLIHSVSFGDTLSSTPTLRYLSKSHQSKINIVTHNKQVFNRNPYINNLLSFDEYEQIKTENDLVYESFTNAGKIDKNGIEKKFSHIDIRQLHSMDLGFQLQPENMFYDYFPSPFNLNVVLPETYVVLHVTSNWPNRTWDKKNWQKLINWLSDNQIFTVLIGSGYREELHSSYSDKPLDKECPEFDNLYGIDLTNQGTMSDMWWVINESMCIITMDSGPLHLAGTTDTHIIQLGSAINPKLRAPFRNGTQDYKYDFIGGTCSIFCNSDLKYNVKYWGDINHVPPQPYCLEEKPTYECHPQLDSVIEKVNKVLVKFKHKPYKEYFELIHTEDHNKICFNFKETSGNILKLVVKDISTGLVRDSMIMKCDRLEDSYYWWAPSPGYLENLGNIDLIFYLNDHYYGSLRLNFPGENNLLVNGNKIIFNDLDDEIYSVFWEVFVNKEYNTFSDISVERGDVVLDIGANYGFFTLYSLNLGASKVYSVEPVDLSFQTLVKLSKDYPIKPIKYAITENGEDVEMTLNEKTPAKNCLSTHNHLFDNDGETIKVKSQTINQLIGTINEKINLVKIDCEGCEYNIFNSINDSVLKQIPKLMIETHDDETQKFIQDKLISNNFEVKINNSLMFALNKN